MSLPGLKQHQGWESDTISLHLFSANLHFIKKPHKTKNKQKSLQAHFPLPLSLRQRTLHPTLIAAGDELGSWFSHYHLEGVHGVMGLISQAFWNCKPGISSCATCSRKQFDFQFLAFVVCGLKNSFLGGNPWCSYRPQLSRASSAFLPKSLEPDQGRAGVNERKIQQSQRK